MQMRLQLEVSHGQLAVFASQLDRPFNDWCEQHVKQGFSWRPLSVTFRTLVESGPHSLDVRVLDNLGEVQPDVVRAVEVPFEVPPDGRIELASIFDSVPLELPPGTCALRCEFLELQHDPARGVRLTFALRETPRFAIVRADPLLSPLGGLLTSAKAAGT